MDPNTNPTPTPKTPPVQNTAAPLKPMPASNTLIILLVVLVLMLLGTTGYMLFQNMKLQNQINSLTASPSPSASSTPTADNSKTYTNSKFGFSFKYPADLFVYQGNPQPDSQFWSNRVNGGAPLELGENGVWLNMSFTNPDSATISLYNKIINLKINETITQSGITKLSNINSSGVGGATYHQGTPPNFAGEPANSYIAVWVKGNTVYKLEFSAFTEENLQKYKGDFENIVSSFNFSK